MSELFVEELQTTLTQRINLNQYRTYHIDGIKIKVIMNNAPSGVFTFKVKTTSGDELYSVDFDSDELKSDLDTTDNYLYLFKVFSIPSALVLKVGSYDFELSSSGYTYSTETYLGWIKSHENIFNAVNGTPDSYANNPYDVLIYERVKEDLTR